MAEQAAPIVTVGPWPVVDVLPFNTRVLTTVLKVQTDKIYHWSVLTIYFHLLNGRDVMLFNLTSSVIICFFLVFTELCTGLYEICIDSPRMKRNQ